MMKTIFAFATLTLAIATAASNKTNVQITVPTEFGGQVLKPGEYTLELKDNNRAVLKSGKNVVEGEARVETEAKKFNTTAVRYSAGEPNAKLDEIRIGGTTTKVVFTKSQASGN
jgi:hypothetical protein